MVQVVADVGVAVQRVVGVLGHGVQLGLGVEAAHRTGEHQRQAELLADPGGHVLPLSPQTRPITTRCSPRSNRRSRSASGVARCTAPSEAARSAPGARASWECETPLTAIDCGKDR